MINSVKFWNHRIDLGQGICTGGSSGINQFDRFMITKELQGKSVLDIGAWDGYDSFKAEQYGAKRVLATDVWYNAPFNKEYWDTIRNGNEGFLYAKKILNSKVDHLNIDILSMSEQSPGPFDVVFFVGVLYHLQHPLKALQILASICREMLILESAIFSPKDKAVEKFNQDTPIMNFRGTSGWFPNKKCLEEMLTVAGFQSIDYQSSKPVSMTERDLRTGILTGSAIVFSSHSQETVLKTLSKGTFVKILNTELGNMDLANPEAKTVRIEWVDPPRKQG